MILSAYKEAELLNELLYKWADGKSPEHDIIVEKYVGRKTEWTKIRDEYLISVIFEYTESISLG